MIVTSEFLVIVLKIIIVVYLIMNTKNISKRDNIKNDEKNEKK